MQNAARNIAREYILLEICAELTLQLAQFHMEVPHFVPKFMHLRKVNVY